MRTLSRPSTSSLLPLLASAALLTACASAHHRRHASAPAPKAPAAAAAPTPAAPKAVQTAAATPAPVHAVGHTRRTWGVVKVVDASAGKLSIQDKAGRTRDFVLASEAKLDKGGDKVVISAADIKVGDRVTVAYAGDVAASVHVNVIASTGNLAKAN